MTKTAKQLLTEANCGIVGISAELEIHGGFDDMFEVADASGKAPFWWDESEPWVPMSTDEKVKLADKMIARWTKYRTAATA